MIFQFHQKESIEVVKMDDVLKNIPVTFIKMDIQGADIAALYGAEELIKKNRPTLTLCLCHRPDDLFVVPKYIKNLDLNYKFYFRMKENLYSDIALVAVPR